MHWNPPQWIWPFNLLGWSFYEAMMWLALGVGTLVWVLLSREWKLGWWQTILSVIAIGICGTLFTKLVHGLVYSWELYSQQPFRWFLLQGKSVHGTMLGFTLFALLFSRWRRLPLARVSDNLAWWIPIGLIFTRLGNFWTADIVGTQTTLPWAVKFSNAPDFGSQARHPVTLYEALFCLLLLIAMIIATQKGARRHPWLLTSLVLIAYNTARFFFDFIKDCPVVFDTFWLTKGQALSLPFIALGVYLAWRSRGAPQP